MAKWNNMTNVAFDEIQAGASASLTRTLSQTDIEALALVSGDADPFHIAEDGTMRPSARTTEAAGVEALIAGALGTRLPGPGMKILHENLQYRGTIADGAGIVLGTRVPIVLTSRADSVRTRLASTVVMTLVAHARRAGKFPTR